MYLMALSSSAKRDPTDGEAEEDDDGDVRGGIALVELDEPTRINGLDGQHRPISGTH